MGKPRRKTRTKYRADDVALGWRGTWAVADIHDQGTGKRTRIRLGELSEDDAKKAIDAFAEKRRLIKAQQAAHTVGYLWSLWLADREKDGFSNDIYGYNWRALEPVFGHRTWDGITTDDFRAYAQARFDQKRKSQTVHTELSRLRYCLKWAAKERLIGYAPEVWTPSRGAGRSLRVSPDDARRLLSQAGDPHIKLFILLALTTGARHMAILDLTWDRVNWAANTISYDEPEDRNPMHKSYRKGRATVPMGSALRAALEIAYEARQTDHVIEHGGRRIASVREGFGNAVWRAGIDRRITPHSLRHAVATWAKEGGADWHRVAQLLGHQDSKTTELFYTHADPVQYLSSTVEAIDAEFATLPANGDSKRKPGVRRQKKSAGLSRSGPEGT